MKDEKIDFKLFWGFALGLMDRQTDKQTNGQMDGQTDICDCRVAFATENIFSITQCFILTDSSVTVKCWNE